MKTHEKFLEFNGRKVYFLNADGQWWIALKPICEALGVDYEAQRKRVALDPILGGVQATYDILVQGRPTGGSAPSKQTVQTPGESGVGIQRRKMLCLPERYIYGWLFTVESTNVDLTAYKRTCYDLLFQHFHGVITNRVEAIKERVLALKEMEQVRRDLEQDPRWVRLQELQGVVLAKGKELKQADRKIELEQYSLFQEN